MQRWEYALFHWSPNTSGRTLVDVDFSSREKWEPVKGDSLMEILHLLGEEGWERVSAQREGLFYNGYNNATHSFYFKRASQS